MYTFDSYYGTIKPLDAVVTRGLVRTSHVERSLKPDLFYKNLKNEGGQKYSPKCVSGIYPAEKITELSSWLVLTVLIQICIYM